VISSARLAPLLELAKQRQQHAACSLAQQQQLLHVQQQRLAELQCYHQEYADSSTINTHDIGQLLAYRAFVSRLEQAIQQQQHTAEQQHLSTQAEQQQWLSAHQAVLKLEHLAKTCRMRQQQADERQALQQMDDFSRRRSTFKFNGHPL